jgi:protein SCO1/2
MHSEVQATAPGKCKKCGMALKIGTPAPAADAGAPIRIPDVTVQDQNGRSLSFYTDLVKGKTVAINFIFTTCTTTCPLLAANFRKVQLDLGERAGRDVHLISISVDPLTDIPERLQAFAAQHHAGPGWTFVTGAQPQIDQLLRGLGASVADKNSHTP